jgi:hypothetical protein
LLPECPARDDVLCVATELGSNALEHTASGDPGGWFVVEVTWRQSTVQVAVTDCGGPPEPTVISDPDAERGRGLLLVKGLSLRTGWVGDMRGRLVWAQIGWPDEGLVIPGSSEYAYEATVGGDNHALAVWFAGVPAWSRWSALALCAMEGSAALLGDLLAI